MPKALCITGMVISALICVVFLIDLLMPVSMAPFKNASWRGGMGVAFILCAALLGYLSWSTWKEQI